MYQPWRVKLHQHGVLPLDEAVEVAVSEHQHPILLLYFSPIIFILFHLVITLLSLVVAGLVFRSCIVFNKDINSATPLRGSTFRDETHKNGGLGLSPIFALAWVRHECSNNQSHCNRSHASGSSPC